MHTSSTAAMASLFPDAVEGIHFTILDGRVFPIVAGGADGDPPADPPADPTSDPEPAPADPAPDPADADPEPTGPDWKALARKHEKRAKENADAAAQLARIREANQTPSEKVINEAREAAKAEVRLEHAQALAGARLEAALTGIVDDPAEFVDDLNLAKFVTDAGEVDTEAIATVKAKYQKAAMAAKPGSGSADGGARGRDDKPKRSSSLEGAVEKALSGS